jgi:hypothetical protein
VAIQRLKSLGQSIDRYFGSVGTDDDGLAVILVEHPVKGVVQPVPQIGAFLFKKRNRVSGPPKVREAGVGLVRPPGSVSFA